MTEFSPNPTGPYVPPLPRQDALDAGKAEIEVPEDEATDAQKSPGLGVTNKFPAAEVYLDGDDPERVE